MEQIALVLFENNAGEILLHLKDDREEILFGNQWSLLEGSAVQGDENTGQMVRSIMEDFSIHPKAFNYFNSYTYYSEKHNAQFELFVFVCKANLSLLKITLHEGQKVNYFHPRELPVKQLPPIISTIIQDYTQKKEIQVR